MKKVKYAIAILSLNKYVTEVFQISETISPMRNFRKLKCCKNNHRLDFSVNNPALILTDS